MSQSHPRESDPLDPLLAFNTEFAAPESAQNPTNPAPAAARSHTDDVSPLRLRLDHAERSLDRARIEISALKSDLATLVTAVDDIKKRLSRRPEAVVVAPPVRVPPRRGLLKVVGIAFLCLAIGSAIWSMAPADVIEVSTPAPFDSARESASVAQDRPVETGSAVALVAEPATVVPPAAVKLQAVADVAATPAPFDSARESASVAQHKPAQEQAERTPRQGAYVGTLSIDAAPAGEVFIDRRPAGRTPVRAENLRAGSHLIWIEREGYRRWTRVVAVAADRVSRVSAQLDPLPR